MEVMLTKIVGQCEWSGFPPAPHRTKNCSRFDSFTNPT